MPNPIQVPSQPEGVSGSNQAPAPQVAPSDLSNASLIDILLSENLLTQDQYNTIKTQSEAQNTTAEQLLLAMKVVPEEKIAEAKAKMVGVPYVSLESTSFSPQALSFLPKSVVERFTLIPFYYDEKLRTLSVAMADPVDLDALAFVRQKTGLTIKTFAASPSEIKDSIEKQYKEELVGEVGKAIRESQQLAPQKNVVKETKVIQEDVREAPIAKITSTILSFAVNSRSSDVHIEPLEDRIRVRYRIDGILYDKISLPINVQDALISRIKILSDMKIDEHRTPQDGRFNFKVGDQEVDLRVSVIPTVFGEKVVMRLLRKSGGIPTLQDLGLMGTALKSLETSILKPHGIILVCGPTGSGKTTTLYSVLSRLNTTRVNIVSLEDPVEYQIPGVNQVQVNPAVGLTFASGLRSFLRQDPNIILVGEIRDKETTDLALQASLTGHLVFSTLHTSDAAGALPRLIDLGAESFLLASTINALVSQRIVRKLCTTCREPYSPPPQLLTEIKQSLGQLYKYKDSDVKFFRARGCSECGSSGYTGRIGIFEVLPISEKVAHLILTNPDTTEIQKQAILEGMVTMKQDGYRKVLQGQTTMEEVLRVAQE